MTTTARTGTDFRSGITTTTGKLDLSRHFRMCQGSQWGDDQTRSGSPCNCMETFYVRQRCRRDRSYGNRGREGFWVDYETTGKLDLFVKNYKDANGFTNANRLYHNNGNGFFTMVANAEVWRRPHFGRTADRHFLSIMIRRLDGCGPLRARVNHRSVIVRTGRWHVCGQNHEAGLRNIEPCQVSRGAITTTMASRPLYCRGNLQPTERSRIRSTETTAMGPSPMYAAAGLTALGN